MPRSYVGVLGAEGHIELLFLLHDAGLPGRGQGVRPLLEEEEVTWGINTRLLV